MNRLSARGVIVTGSSGMAADAVLRFTEEGARVFVIGKVADECRALNVPYALADLSNEDEAVAAFDAARRVLGRVDAVYGAAGGSGRAMGDGPLHSVPLDGWKASFDLNVTTAFLTAREAVRLMLDQPRDDDGSRGSVVLLASVLAWSPAPAFFATHAYASAKAAIVGLVRSAASYYAGTGVRINALAPGLVRTPMSARAASDASTMAFTVRKQALTGGILAARHVTELAVELCSARTTALTGQLIAVDGGWSVLDAAAALSEESVVAGRLS